MGGAWQHGGLEEAGREHSNLSFLLVSLRLWRRRLLYSDLVVPKVTKMTNPVFYLLKSEEDTADVMWKSYCIVAADIHSAQL